MVRLIASLPFRLYRSGVQQDEEAKGVFPAELRVRAEPGSKPTSSLNEVLN